jgi:hypothetical protein
LQFLTRIEELRNVRSPKLDLERLYADGPTGHPFLYQRDDPAKFLLGLDEADLQRNVDGIAIIGDPRDDSHMLISQLHLAMLKAHNVFVDEARLAGMTSDRVFEDAASQLRWHYQWIVLNEFLPGHWSSVRRSRARHLGVEPLTSEQVGIASIGWRDETPLWYYILREAGVCTASNHLGPVGGRIVTENFCAQMRRGPHNVAGSLAGEGAT